MKRLISVSLLVVSTVALVPTAEATSVNPAEWDFSLETSGADAFWTSSTNVPTGYSQYEHNFHLDYMEFKVSSLGWYDMTLYLSGSGTENGLPFTFGGFDFGIGEVFEAHFNGGVDGDGYGFAQITDVVLGNYLSYDVEDVRCGGTITVTAVPEPGTVCLLGLGVLVGMRRHRTWLA